PADRRTNTAIKSSYHPVPSGLLQKQGASHRLFGKTNLGKPQGCSQHWIMQQCYSNRGLRPELVLNCPK
ncbi:hypothetical protein LEMLEM_LOCUS4826, partial [Lemmus lemmus]